MKSAGLCTVTFAVLWILVISLTNPSDLGMFSFALFYALFFLMMTGICSLTLMFFTARSSKAKSQEITSEHISLRQGALVAALLTSVLLFQQLNIFAWWVGLLLLGAVFLVELFFLSRPR